MIALSFAERVDLTYGSDDAMEKAHVQYVSGSMFGAFGLRPAAGRLLSENDDLKPGAHPVAVLSHDYWSRRFADGSERGRAYVPDCRPDLRDRRRRQCGLHRHRAGNGDRRLHAGDDALGNGARMVGVPGLRAIAPGVAAGAGARSFERGTSVINDRAAEQKPKQRRSYSAKCC